MIDNKILNKNINMKEPEESEYHLLKNKTKDAYSPYYEGINSFC